MPPFRYELEVLTPLHIGSGERIYPIEYMIDEDFIRIDMDKLFADSSFQIERFIRESKRRDFYLGNFDKTNAIKHPLYKLDINPQAGQEVINNIGRQSALILDFIKEGKNFYIPGSSIKGAVRTAILWQALEKSKENKRNFDLQLKRKIERIMNEKKTKGRSRVKREQFSIPAEETILGNPNRSLLRALQISDSYHLPFSSLNITCAKVLSKVGNSFKWKQLGYHGNNVDRPEKATSTFVETVKPGTVVSGSLKIEDFLLQEEVAAGLGLKETALITNIAKTCNEFSLHHIKGEIAFFKGIGFLSIQKELERIKALNLEENAFLLHFAWGSGYSTKALGKDIDSLHLFENIKKEQLMPRGWLESSPKTRKIVFEGKVPRSVMGWVKIRLM